MERFKGKNLFFVLLVGIIIFAIFASEIGYEKFLHLLGSVNKLFVLLVIVLNLMNLLTFTMTWKFLIPSVNISFKKLFKIYMAGTFINNITPSFGTGGEPVKAMLLGKQTGISKAECFAGVISQRMLNMFPFLSIGLIGTVLLVTRPELRLGAWELSALVFSIVISFLIFGLLIYFYIRKDKLSSFVHSSIRFLSPFIGLVKKGFDQKAYALAAEESINSFHGGLRNIHDNKAGLKNAIFFSFLGWFFDIMAIYAVFLSIPEETNIQISVLIITYTISMVSSWLPLFLPGGLGIVDGTMATLFIFSGVPLEIALLATLLYRLASYWFNTVLGAVCLYSALKD